MNLNNVKYINDFRRLPYPKNEMLIVGTGVMALLGLKKNKDIDVWATDKIIKKVSKDKNYIHKKSKTDGFPMYERKDGKIEFMSTLPPITQEMDDNFKRAIVIYGIQFQNPKDVLRWKKLINRPKDKEDIRLLEKYLKDNVVESYLMTMQNLKG